MINNVSQTTVTAIDATNTADDLSREISFRHSYHELADQHVVETDVLEQLKSNMGQLEDLHGRLKFMMLEVQSLIRK